jgi:hypothetical protein
VEYLKVQAQLSKVLPQEFSQLRLLGHPHECWCRGCYLGFF